MVKLNRTTEYGLISLSYIRQKKEGEVTSAREIADKFALPFEILAKTLQRLKELGIISASYGTRGGYVLARDLSRLNLGEFLGLMEGPVSVVACATHSEEKHACEYSGHCNIKHMMSGLNTRVYEFLNRISLEELTRSQLNLPEPVLYGEEP